MRWLVAIGMVVRSVVPGAVHADPGAPQLDPSHGRREDAHRLREQLQGLDREGGPGAAPVEPATPVEPPHPEPAVTGVVPLCIAGAAGVTAGALYLVAPTDTDGLQSVLLVTALVAGAAGLTIVLWNRSVRAAPRVTAGSVGLAIAGRL